MPQQLNTFSLALAIRLGACSGSNIKSGNYGIVVGAGRVYIICRYLQISGRGEPLQHLKLYHSGAACIDLISLLLTFIKSLATKSVGGFSSTLFVRYGTVGLSIFMQGFFFFRRTLQVLLHGLSN